MATTGQRSAQQLVRLAFRVPKGFEDVAWQDIRRFLPVLPADTASTGWHVKFLSGLVLLSLPFGPQLEACLSKYAEGVFWSVIRLSLCMDCPCIAVDDISAIPDRIVTSLEADRKSLPSKRSRQILNPEASKGRNSRYRRRVAPLDIDSTPSELAFLDFLTELVHSQHASHSMLYSLWKSLKGSAFVEDRAYLPASFAVRFERGDFLFPTLKSPTIASHLADLYGTQLLRMTGKDEIKADLASPEYEVSRFSHCERDEN